uniref:OVATE domain-containing protein n=1 Tax=Leersia perrieri TaxID=77586 RepID=A0A0D9X2X8_9ORYZ
MPSCCLHCNPCRSMLALFKRRPRPSPPSLLLRRRRRRRRAGSFSSVRAVFWPLMSMRSDADRNDTAPPPPPSLDDDDATPAAAASTTAARVLAIQAQLGEAAAAAASSTKQNIGGGGDCDGGGEKRNEGVEEACRSFEKHLMEMLVEERKVRDLMDVEELLCCWEKLRSPVFVELVGRFYGELCVDLFSGRGDDDDVSSDDDSQDLSL